MEEKHIPLVSVVMPAYNAERYIGEAIHSVQAQTVSDWELIVVNDCSTDGTAAQIKELAGNDSRIIPVFNDVNRGAAASRNLALDMCRGEYVALLDADDRWYPEKLERQLKKAKETGADIIYCSYALMDEQGEKCHRDFIVDETTDFQKMLTRSVMSCSTVLLQRDILQVHRFSETIYHEDYALWLTLLQSGCTAAGITDVLADYRMLAGSRSSNKMKNAVNRWKVYREYLHMPLVPSIRAMVGYTINGLIKYR